MIYPSWVVSYSSSVATVGSCIISWTVEASFKLTLKLGSFSSTCHATLLCCKLKSVVARITTQHFSASWTGLYFFFNKFFQLATTTFVAWQCLRWVVIRATTHFNLQRNSVVCSYYFNLVRWALYRTSSKVGKPKSWTGVCYVAIVALQVAAICCSYFFNLVGGGLYSVYCTSGKVSNPKSWTLA